MISLIGVPAESLHVIKKLRHHIVVPHECTLFQSQNNFKLRFVQFDRRNRTSVSMQHIYARGLHVSGEKNTFTLVVI